MSTVNPRISAWALISNFGFFPFRVVFELITVVFRGHLCLSSVFPGTLKVMELKNRDGVLAWGSTVLNLILQKETPQIPGCWRVFMIEGAHY